MFEKIDGTKAFLKEKAAQTTQSVNEFVEHENTKAAVAWTKETIGTASDEAMELGKRAARSTMVKDVVIGAAIGASASIPFQGSSPIFFAIIGAGLGVFKFFKSSTSREASVSKRASASAASQKNIHKQLIELDDLRQKGILSQVEFEIEKNKILKS